MTSIMLVPVAAVARMARYDRGKTGEVWWTWTGAEVPGPTAMVALSPRGVRAKSVPWFPVKNMISRVFALERCGSEVI